MKVMLNHRSSWRVESALTANRWRQNLAILKDNLSILPAVLRNYRAVLRGQSRLRALEISVGYRCQLSCDQCSCARTYDPSRGRLTLAELFRAIDQARDLGAFQFNLTGGDPLIYYDDVLALIDYLGRKKCYAHLCTNAVALTYENLSEMRRLGLCSIEMGLDSARRQTHDANRCPGNYDKIMEVLQWTARLGMRTILNTVITREKIANRDMANLVRLVQQTHAHLQITPPCAVGHWSGKMEVLLQPEEEEYLRRLLGQRQVRSDIFSSFISSRCSAGREKLAITPYGDVMPCSLVQISYGNVRQHPLARIHQEVLKNPFYHQVTRQGCVTSFNRAFINHYFSQPCGLLREGTLAET
jgi:MoaA/NifB/PqqE/SkfB family radical SAM enzyme